MLPGLSMACKGTGTAPCASVAWSMLMAFRPLGSRMATRAPAGSWLAARARCHCVTRSRVAAQLRLSQRPLAVSNSRKASPCGLVAARKASNWGRVWTESRWGWTESIGQSVRIGKHAASLKGCQRRVADGQSREEWRHPRVNP